MVASITNLSLYAALKDTAERKESAGRYINLVSGAVGQHFALHFKPAAFAQNL